MLFDESDDFEAVAVAAPVRLVGPGAGAPARAGNDHRARGEPCRRRGRRHRPRPWPRRHGVDAEGREHARTPIQDARSSGSTAAGRRRSSARSGSSAIQRHGDQDHREVHEQQESRDRVDHGSEPIWILENTLIGKVAEAGLNVKSNEQ